MTALEKWKNDFKEFISELSMPRDDYKGIMEYIDEVPNEALEQQPCDDCISRQEAINCITLNEFRYKIVEDIKTLPSVTPKEKTGRWIQQPRYDDDDQPDLVCPNCGFKISWWDMGNFCAKCGTGLEGGAE